MAGYEDTKQKIISTLMGRPVGTEIQPENHQDYALNMLDYIRSLELIATSTLIGVAESNTTPVQPNSSRVCYIAGVAQNQTVVFENFIDENGNPISVTTGDMEGVFIILLWDTQYWSAQTFSTNIISQSESATFYYRYNIRKTYESVALMNADVSSPIGTDGKYIKVGDIVTVVNSTTPSENGIYSYEGATEGWKYQSSFNFQLSQTTGTDANVAMSQKVVTDELALKVDKTSVKQVIGASTTDVMSQKAVTDKLTELESKGSIFDLKGQNNLLVTPTIAMIKGGHAYEISLNKTEWDISGITLQQGTYSLFAIVGVREDGSHITLSPLYASNFPTSNKFIIEVSESAKSAHFEFRASVGESIEVTITDLSALNKITRSEMPLAETSLWFDDIYESTTSNLLDVKHPLFGIYAVEEGEGNIHFLKDDTYKSAISRLIPVSHIAGGNVTISGVKELPGGTKIVFLKDADLSSAIALYNIVIESRTVPVPENAKYAVVVLSANTGADFRGIKLSDSNEITEDEYIPRYVGNIHDVKNPMLEGDLGFMSKTSNLVNTSDVDTDLRVTDDKPYFVAAYSGVKMAKPIFVRGQKYVTIKSNSKQPNNRWVAWTKDTSRTEESVISVVAGMPPTPDDNVVISTLAVPDGAVYMYYTLATAGTDNDNWKGTTIAFGKNASSEQYEAGGDIYRYKDKYFYSASNQQKETDLVYVSERERVYKNALPFSVGSPSENLSFDNQYERCNLIFFTDSHIDLRNPVESLDNVKQTIQFANEGRLPISALIHTGDLITPFDRSAKSDVKGVAKPFFDALKQTYIPSVFAIGNHDNNDWNNTPDNIFRAEDWGEMWLNYAEENYGIVRQTKADGIKSTWHYLDLPEWKIRIISVDAQDIDHDTTNVDGNALYYGGKAWYVSNEQMLWLANTALNINEDGWGVIVCLHQTYSGEGYWYSTSLSPAFEGSIQKMMNMLVAFAKHETYNQNAYTNSNPFYNLDAISKDFSFSSLSDKPRLICVLNGHEHFDRVDNYNGVNVIWTSNNSATTVSSDSRVARILGTSTQNLFDVVNIDTKQHKLRVFRFGANMNCYGDGGDRFVPDGLDY